MSAIRWDVKKVVSFALCVIFPSLIIWGMCWDYLLDALQFVKASDDRKLLVKLWSGISRVPGDLGLTILPVCLMGIIGRWTWGEILAVLGVFGLVLVSGAYQHRLVYFVFSIFLMFPGRRRGGVYSWLMVLLISCSFAASVIGRSYLSVVQFDSRTPGCHRSDISYFNEVIAFDGWFRYWYQIEKGNVPVRYLE